MKVKFKTVQMHMPLKINVPYSEKDLAKEKGAFLGER